MDGNIVDIGSSSAFARIEAGDSNAPVDPITHVPAKDFVGAPEKEVGNGSECGMPKCHTRLSFDDCFTEFLHRDFPANGTI